MLPWFVSFLSVAVAASTPFWKVKEKVYERVRNGEVVVAVKSVEGRPPFARAMTIAGGGRVAAPRDFVVAFAQDFDRVARLSGFIEKSTYHKDTGLLDIHLSALGHRAHMKIAVSAPKAEPPRVDFDIREGPLRGLRSQVDFVAVGPRTTEVGIEGRFDYDEFPIPRLFLEFGLEVVFQKMAARLRSEVESAYKSGGDRQS